VSSAFVCFFEFFTLLTKQGRDSHTLVVILNKKKVAFLALLRLFLAFCYLRGALILTMLASAGATAAPFFAIPYERKHNAAKQRAYRQKHDNRSDHRGHEIFLSAKSFLFFCYSVYFWHSVHLLSIYSFKQ
jgi:hypothetical protein